MSLERARGTGPRRGRLALALVSAAVVLVADQVTKHLAAAHLAAGPVHLLGPLSLRLELNTGIAFSLGAGSAWPVVAAALALVGVLAWFARAARTPGSALALGMVVGGALGNLADRVVGAHHGAVVDFLYTGFWPTFNLADASIVLGCALLLLAFWRHERAGAAGRPGRVGEEAGQAPEETGQAPEEAGQAGACCRTRGDGSLRPTAESGGPRGEVAR